MTSPEKLDYIYQFLLRISGGGQKSNLGFQRSPQPEVVYVGECSGKPWYKMSDNSDAGRQPIEQNFVCGYLVDLEIKQKRSTEYGDRMKLRVHLQCGDNSYALVSGLGTYFSRALVSGLGALPNDFDFATSPIGVEAVTGEKGKVVLPTLYVMKGGGWNKVKCDAAGMDSEEKMTNAVNEKLRGRISKCHE
jgi:hypothetical protein